MFRDLWIIFPKKKTKNQERDNIYEERVDVIF
jgi:hypothetical protein